MVSITEIRAAQERIGSHIRRTPVVRVARLDETFGAELYLKCENLQEAGAFKSRGACNAVFSLSDEEARHGVVTHSSGNHAAALSRAAARRGIPAYIVMPSTARRGKCRPCGDLPARLRSASRRWPIAREPRRGSWRRPAPRWCTPTTMTGSLPGRGPPPSSCSRTHQV